MRRFGMPARILVPVLLTSVLTTSCWNPFDPPPPIKPPPPPPLVLDRSSRMNLIHYFEAAHEDRDIEAYQECLHDQYSFWFWEDEISVWPRPWIDRSEDIDVTENMFLAEVVTDVQVDFLNLTDVPGAATEEERFNLVFVPGEGGVDTVWVGDFKVDMHVIEDNGEQMIDHWVDGRADLHLVRDPKFPGSWCLWQIRDRGNEYKSDATSEWTELKRTFR